VKLFASESQAQLGKAAHWLAVGAVALLLAGLSACGGGGGGGTVLISVCEAL
jgi:hypothetical protein